MSIAGETIDYGPCAFMDYYDHDQVYSSIDRNGRYAYSNQPSIGLWNLTRLAETFLPLVSDDNDAAVQIAQDILKNYIEVYERCWLEGMREKLGLSGSQDNDKELIEELLNIMAINKADFTLTFYSLSQLNIYSEIENSTEQEKALYDLFADAEAVKHWLVKWKTRLAIESLSDKSRRTIMLSVNPVYIPRNHQIEAAIRAAEDSSDFSVFHDLYDVLQKPYEQQLEKEAYMLPPMSDEIVKQTFCGT